MVALIIGIVFVLFAIYSVFPPQIGGALNWWNDVIQFLKGGVPIIALLIGLIAVFIGVADIKDKVEMKKEEAEEAKEEAAKENSAPEGSPKS